jgi:DNA-binding IclR family transcriptional regulator
MATKLLGDPPRRDQRHIQSIEVGFRLIEVLERARSNLPLKVIAERADMPASKAHLYMVSFMRLGLVSQDQNTMHYGLGPYTIQLGMAGLRNLDIVQVSKRILIDLQIEYKFSVFLSIWGNKGPTIVSKIDGDLEIPMAITIGYVLPILTSATGRVFLALLPDYRYKSALHNASGGPAREDAIVEAARAEMNANGLARSDSRVFDGFAALSGAVLNGSGTIEAAITVLGLRSQVDLDYSGNLALSLKEACAAVSGLLGFMDGG